jgi:excisionase family DNA binding protein
MGCIHTLTPLTIYILTFICSPLVQMLTGPNMQDHLIEKHLSEIKDHIVRQTVSQKEILTLGEAAVHAGISKSFLYKLTSKRLLPFYRPGDAKLIFFKRAELDAWLLTNRKPTIAEMALLLPKKKNGND